MPPQSRLTLTGILLLACALPVLGCSSYSFYAAEYNVESSSRLVIPESISNMTRQKLSSSRSIAFVPPDTCFAGDELGFGDAEPLLQIPCGAFMSDIEQRASDAGWEVLSWRTLDPADVFAVPTAENTDLLVQINDIRVTTVAGRATEDSRVDFRRADRNGRLGGTWYVRESLAPVCALNTMQGVVANAIDTVGIDAQVMTVADGTVLYHHRSILALEDSVQRSGVLYWATGDADNDGSVCFQKNYHPRGYEPGTIEPAQSTEPHYVSTASFSDRSATALNAQEKLRRERLDEILTLFFEALGEPAPEPAARSWQRSPRVPSRESAPRDSDSTSAPSSEPASSRAVESETPGESLTRDVYPGGEGVGDEAP